MLPSLLCTALPIENKNSLKISAPKIIIEYYIEYYNFKNFSLNIWQTTVALKEI